MSKKKQIRKLKKRVADLEFDLALLRGQRTTITWSPPSEPYPFTLPRITCGSSTSAPAVKSFTYN